MDIQFIGWPVRNSNAAILVLLLFMLVSCTGNESESSGGIKDTIVTAKDTLIRADSSADTIAPTSAPEVRDVYREKYAGVHNDTTLFEDLNEDGQKDSLIYSIDGGSGFGGSELRIWDGRTKKYLEWGRFWCFCDLVGISLVPPDFRKPENKTFRLVAEAIMFNKPEPLTDPGFQHIIDVRLHHREADSGGYVRTMITAPLRWNNGPVEIPDGQLTTLMTGDTLDRIYSTSAEKPEWYQRETNTGWVTYNPGDHGGPFIGKKPAPNSVTLFGLKIMATRHGVIAERNNQWAWLFITDHSVTDGVDKLRWNSIDSIFAAGGLLFISVFIETGVRSQFAVIDPATGYCALLHYDYTTSRGDSILEQNGQLILIDQYADSRATAIDLKKLKVEMKRLSGGRR